MGRRKGGCAVCGGALGAGDQHCSRRCAALWRHHGRDPVKLAALRLRLAAEAAGELSAVVGGGEVEIRRAEVALQALRRRRAREKAAAAAKAKARCWRAGSLADAEGVGN